MSDMTEHLNWADDDDDRQPNCWEQHRLEHKTTWMLKDKTVVNIYDMTTQHIRNSITMLENMDNDWTNCPAYKGLQKELQIRMKNEY